MAQTAQTKLKVLFDRGGTHWRQAAGSGSLFIHYRETVVFFIGIAALKTQADSPRCLQHLWLLFVQRNAALSTMQGQSDGRKQEVEAEAVGGGGGGVLEVATSPSPLKLIPQ